MPTQRDQPTGRRAGQEGGWQGSKGVGKEYIQAARATGLHVPLSVLVFLLVRVFLAIIGVQGHVFPTFPLCFYTSLLVFLFGTRATLIGGRRERKGKCLPPAMGVRLGQGKRQGLEA